MIYLFNIFIFVILIIYKNIMKLKSSSKKIKISSKAYSSVCPAIIFDLGAVEDKSFGIFTSPEKLKKFTHIPGFQAFYFRIFCSHIRFRFLKSLKRLNFINLLNINLTYTKPYLIWFRFDFTYSKPYCTYLKLGLL